MSYKLTVYFQDECIDSTYIYTQHFTHTGYYGDDFYSTTGLTFEVRLEATPASGCKFTRWVYRVGSTTGTVQYSTSNPFIYNGEENLYIRAEGEYIGGGGSGGTQIYVSPWDWAISNGSASAEQTQTASNSATKGGVVSGFSYLVWNDMVDKVKAILDATNDVWDSRYADYEATKMTSSDRKLTAKRFNSLRYNIGIETGIGEVAKGDIVYGSYFRTLASKISFWIYELNGEVVH